MQETFLSKPQQAHIANTSLSLSPPLSTFEGGKKKQTQHFNVHIKDALFSTVFTEKEKKANFSHNLFTEID